MLKNSRSHKSFLLLLTLTGLLIFAHPASGAPYGNLDNNVDQELVDSELAPTADDLPPPAEYPYPGAKEEGISPEDAHRVAHVQPEAPIVRPNMNLERPKKINEDTGDYLYETKIEKPIPAQRESGHLPQTVLENGDYHYDTNLTAPAFSNRDGVEKPVEIKGNGEFKYATEQTPTTGTASFRFGLFGPPLLQNEVTKTTFQQIYTRDQLPVLFLDYEFPLTTKLGHIGLRIGSGIFVASGQGQFVTDAVTDGRRANDVAQERYTFLMFPNTLTARYSFQYKDSQPIVPYIEGGAGYFVFGEIRDDNSSPRVGGALTTVGAGGLNLLMDWLDPQAIRNLDLDYGINHVYLNLEARQIVGLNKTYDFSSSAFNAGFLLQF